MSSVIISGDTSGAVTVAAPAVAGTNTLTLQAATATNSVNTLATAVASTSGTSIDFTSLPNWIKRITVMFAGVSTTGSSSLLVQIGAGSFTITGYSGQCNAGGALTAMSTGFMVNSNMSAANLHSGNAVINTLGSNIWSESGLVLNQGVSSNGCYSGGYLTLGGTLDRIRITTVNGTDAFDAGTINILYEG
jgi:hypothetical protein